LGLLDLKKELRYQLLELDVEARRFFVLGGEDNFEFNPTLRPTAEHTKNILKQGIKGVAARRELLFQAAKQPKIAGIIRSHISLMLELTIRRMQQPLHFSAFHKWRISSLGAVQHELVATEGMGHATRERLFSDIADYKRKLDEADTRLKRTHRKQQRVACRCLYRAMDRCFLMLCRAAFKTWKRVAYHRRTTAEKMLRFCKKCINAKIAKPFESWKMHTLYDRDQDQRSRLSKIQATDKAKRLLLESFRKRVASKFHLWARLTVEVNGTRKLQSLKVFANRLVFIARMNASRFENQKDEDAMVEKQKTIRQQRRETHAIIARSIGSAIGVSVSPAPMPASEFELGTARTLMRATTDTMPTQGPEDRRRSRAHSTDIAIMIARVAIKFRALYRRVQAKQQAAMTARANDHGHSEEGFLQGGLLALRGTEQGRSGWYEAHDKQGELHLSRWEIERGSWELVEGPVKKKYYLEACALKGNALLVSKERGEREGV
jgi:hypothetical protein